MQTSRFAISVLLTSGMVIAQTMAVEAQERQGNATTQALQQDGRYLIYMRGIT